MLKYPILECRQHICQRILEAVGAHPNLNCDILDSKLQLSQRLSNDSPSIDFQITSNALRNLNISNIDHILCMGSDSVIKHVSKNSNEQQEDIIFHIDKNEVLTSVLKTAFNTSKKMLRFTPKNNVLIEFSSPNIAKPFHMGHLRSTIVGNFVSNIIGLSSNIKRLNYLGDWGTQIGYVKLGLDSMNVPDVFLLENPMKALYDAYSIAYNKGDMLNKAKEIFAQLEKNCSTWTEQWEKIRSITVEHLRKTYSSFGIVFDEYLYESDYRAGNISHIIDLMKDNGLICVDGDFLAMEMNGMKIPLFKSDGTTLYLVRDIASALDRLNNFECNTLVYVVDKAQSEHLNKLKFALSKLVNTNIIHVPFGRVIGMSTRKGTSIFLADILNETVKKMADQQLQSPNTRSTDPEVTRILGVTSLMVYVLRQRRNRDFRFSWENALQASGDTGNKLQYTHSRLCSLEENCGAHLPKEVNPVVFTEPIVHELIYELARFQDILNCCQEELESSVLITYIFKLCNTVSRCLKSLPVKGQPSDVAEQRLLLFHTSRIFLSSSMKILGLKPLNQM